MSKFLLHPELFACAGPFENYMHTGIVSHAREMAAACEGKGDPDVSIVVRTRNDVQALEIMFADLEKQEFVGKKQVVVVDTESTDGTVDAARKHGATVIAMKQADFSYPKSLNLGFEAAKHPFVFSFVGHSALSNTQVLRTATRYADQPRFGGAYGAVLPDRNATFPESLGIALYYPFRKPAHAVRDVKAGVLAANCCMISREAWEHVGRFDDQYGAGGEDGELASRLLHEEYSIQHDLALSVHHTHGVGWGKMVRQVAEWLRMSKPHAFDQERLRKYRHDLDI
jgi:glycosyltransferase involved in cell wall biosynthesis